MRLDRKGIPKEIKSLQYREEKSTMYAYAEEQNIMLVSYIDKKMSGEKDAVVLTTMHNNVRVTKNERRKPDVHVTYNHTKGGVDIVDLISTHNSNVHETKKVAAKYVCFPPRYHSHQRQNILSGWQSHVKLSSLEFTCCLDKMAVLPNIDRRYSNSNGLTIDTSSTHAQSFRYCQGKPPTNPKS